MDAFEFYVSLREDILKVISGVENANGYWGWDDTTPNWVTKNRLETLLDKYVLLAKAFGLYVVTRYATCANPRHEWYPTTTNRYGISIPYQDESFVWGSEQLFQGERTSTCPCSPKNKPHKNHVIDDIIYEKTGSLDDCQKIALILEDLSEAADKSRDNKSRPGIREYLLRAVLRLNDAILSQPVDEYISARQGKS